jgi:hypothetical protein
MRLSPSPRPALVALACIALAVVPACSSGGDKSTGTSGGSAGSLKEYCAAVKTLFDMNAPYAGGTVPTDQQQPLADQAVTAMRLAPPEVQQDFQKSLMGDTYARDNVDQYNKSKCGIDTGAQPAPTP